MCEMWRSAVGASPATLPAATLTLCVLGAAALSAGATALSEEQYYSFPRLYHLDPHAACLSTRGTYCLGSFHLQPQENTQLFTLLQQYSLNVGHFNYTQIHRGLCVSSRCRHLSDLTPKKLFRRCVDDWMTRKYGVGAKLTKLEYCRNKDSSDKQVGRWELALVTVLGLLVLFSCVGTYYDLMIKTEKKENAVLMCWSVAENLKRLTALHNDGDPRRAALKPLDGIRAVTMQLVMLAHTCFAYHISYIDNPQFLEKTQESPLAMLFYNGTVFVQTFVVVSSFLLAYNLLLFADSERLQGKPLSWAWFPRALYLRLIRIGPVNTMVVWWAATWWSRVGGGPMWAPLVSSEGARCRRKWWTQILYVNNFVQPHERCLIQTWFLAVDMQLYLGALVATLAMLRWPRHALKLLGFLFLLSIFCNFLIAAKWNLVAMVFMMKPEALRVQFSGEASFPWLYASPWGSLPACLLGVFLAFLHHRLQRDGFNPNKYKWMVTTYRLSVPLLLATLLSGWLVRGVTDPLLLALYSAVDRPLFSLCSAVLMMGTVYHIDEWVCAVLSWRAWSVLSRLSLSVLMLHWCVTLSYLALRPLPLYVSVLEIWGTWTMVMFVTYLAALPVYLLVEAPVHRMLKVFVR